MSRVVPGLPHGEMKALTQTEAKELRRPMLDALRSYLDWTDQAIWLTGKRTRKEDQPEDWAIWGDMTDLELSTIVDTWLSAGERNPIVAASVRSTVYLWKRLQVGIILAPRFRKMFAFYVEQGGMAKPW
jgi:hypothetical protein